MVKLTIKNAGIFTRDYDYQYYYYYRYCCYHYSLTVTQMDLNATISLYFSLIKLFIGANLIVMTYFRTTAGPLPTSTRTRTLFYRRNPICDLTFVELMIL